MKRLALIALLAGSALALTGCELLDPKVDSPFSGKPVNEAGLAREIRAEEAKAKAEADAKLAEAAEQVRQAKARLIGTNIALQQKASVTAAEIQATAATVEFETGAKIEGAKAAAEAAAKALGDRLALIHEQAGGAMDAIDAKRQQYGGIVSAVANNPFVKTADGASGGLITSLIAASGVTGWAVRSAGSRKRHDQSYDQGVADEKARQEQARERENAAWNEARLDLHQLQAPSIVKPVAPAAA